MKRIISVLLIFLFLVFLPATVAIADQSVPREVLSSAESVVRIVAEYKDAYVTGSGFIIYSDNGSTLVATNYHVVSDSPLSISIWLSTDETISASILATSAQNDLCILKLAYPVSLTALKLNSKDIRQGDAVYAVGYPSAADVLSEAEAHISSEATITDGIVSALRETKVTEYGSPVELLQINAAINSGNSGGPLFNARGEVVGINTLGVLDSQGIFGAISVSELENMMIDNGIEAVQLTKGVSVALICSGIGVLFVSIIIGAIILLRKRRMMKCTETKPDETLQAYLERRARPLSANEAAVLLMPLAVELKHLHESGIAHLEIAPEHIFVAQDVVKLAERTGVESNKYSTGFSAPEIYRGKNCGAKTDIYSFCAVLQYAITGILPENALSRNDEITEDAEAALSDSGAEPDASCNKEFMDIISQGMRLDADERFETMQELIYKLTPFNTHVKAEVKPTEVPIEVPAMLQRSKKERKRLGAKEHKKLRAKVWIPAVAVAVLLLAMGTYFGGYLRAVSLAESGEFKKAERLLFIEPLVALHDDRFSQYIDAGIEFENMQYSNAQTGFQRIADYRNSEDMAREAGYRYAAQLADSNEFDEAITIYKHLADDGYSDSAELVLKTRYRRAVYDLYELGDYRSAHSGFYALLRAGFEVDDDMINEAVYCWACALLDEEDWIGAYEKFSSIEGYSDANDALSSLRELIYLDGQQAYYDEDYVHAAECFSCVLPYHESTNCRFVKHVGQYSYEEKR